MIERYGLSAPEQCAETESAYQGECRIELVEDPERLEQLLELWRQADWVSVLALPTLDGVAVDGAEEDGVCVGAVVLQSRVGAEMYQRFLQILFSGEIQKVTHQAKELMEQLLAEGLSTEGFLFDTALVA